MARIWQSAFSIDFALFGRIRNLLKRDMKKAPQVGLEPTTLRIDLFRCESVALRTYWVLVVMDQYTRRIIGFGIQAGIVDGITLCRMFNRAIRGQMVPKYLSSDHDPLYRFHQWQANLRVLGVTEIKTVPYAPLSQA
jgi:transposase InsO family protein